MPLSQRKRQKRRKILDERGEPCHNNAMNMLESVQQAVTYYTLTEQQLNNIVSRSVTQTLEGLGISLNHDKTKLTNSKDEYKPIAYWLKELNVDRSTLWRWQEKGYITPTRMGRKLFFCQKDFDKMFEMRKEA